MLRSIKQICGDKLGASDGDIGHVKDFYFDDRHWAVRYLVADTGSWLSERSVLLSPHALGSLPPGGKILPVNLTRKQIEDSPATETHKPVSRQYEEAYYQYYGWPYYWQGDGVWGMSGFPILTESLKPFAGEPPTESGAKPDRVDGHLRSAQDIIGYQVQTGDEIAGHVADFLMDDRSWVIGQLVINTGNRFTGKKVLLPPDKIDRISWEESKVFASVTKELLLELPAYDGESPSLDAVTR